jgi:hypothetical protein
MVRRERNEAGAATNTRQMNPLAGSFAAVDGPATGPNWNVEEAGFQGPFDWCIVCEGRREPGQRLWKVKRSIQTEVVDSLTRAGLACHHIRQVDDEAGHVCGCGKLILGARYELRAPTGAGARKQLCADCHRKLPPESLQSYQKQPEAKKLRWIIMVTAPDHVLEQRAEEIGLYVNVKREMLEKHISFDSLELVRARSSRRFSGAADPADTPDPHSAMTCDKAIRAWEKFWCMPTYQGKLLY